MQELRIMGVLVWVILVCSLFYQCARNAGEPVDLAALQSTGDDWKVMVQDTLPEGGHIKLNHDRFLMYFLHWRPLTEENENISVAYARERMLNFWGPDMPFTITSEGGKTEIAGHPAYFIDGSFSNGVVQTRFIVWNCPETKRQFIADCNINKRRGTNDALLELQYEISSTVSCHGEKSVSNNPLLTREYSSEAFNLSFFIPGNWRTYSYPEPEWFPDGHTETNGSLWTMLTDSDKYIDFMWDDNREDISEEVFQGFIEMFKKDTLDFEEVTYTIEDFAMEAIDKKGDYLVGKGSYRYHYDYGERGYSSENFACRAFLWNHKDRAYFLLASIVNKDTWWSRPVDLTPTDEVFNMFLRNEVLPNVPAFRRGIKLD
jgi:hypothetical protein